jgi:hypothetical protein
MNQCIMRNQTLRIGVGLLLLMARMGWADSKPALVMAYFVPSDRVPIPGYQDRVDRVMTEVQKFYREGMQANGYGPTSFDLARDSEGKLQVHVVQGRHDMHAYGRDDSDKVRAEVAKGDRR